jgi:drug/metabolite transporter (DMT)-like permease
LIGAVLFFGEQLNLWQWAGVGTAIVAFYLLSRSGKKEGIDFKHNRWIFSLILACVLGACCGLYDKYLMAAPTAGGLGLDRMVVQTYYNFYQCLLMGIMMLTMWLPKRKTQPFHWSWAIPAISLFLSCADFVYLYALSLDGAMIAVVSMVRRASVLISFCFAAFILKEKNLRDKAVDLGLVVISMILLAIGGIH